MDKMNKIFKVIFSKAKGCYVVVSELAKSTGGGTPNFKIKRGYSLTLAAAVVSMLLGLAPVGAADPVNLGNGGTAAYDDKGNLTVGKVVQGQSTDLKGENNTAIGTKSDTLRNITEGETTKNGQPMDEANTKLVDGEGVAHKMETSTESGGSTAVGYNNKAEGDSSTAIGNNAKIINKPVTYYADKDGNKTTSTDNAAWYKDSSGNPTEVPQVFRDADGNTTTTPQYVHTYTEKDSTTGEEVTKIEITSDATKADQKDGKPVYNYRKSDNLDKLYSVTLYQAASNSIAAGSNVTANGSNAVAVGYSSTADNSAVAIGDTAAAKENTVAIGKNTKATADGSIALGKGSEADRSGGITGWDPKTGTTSNQSALAWKSTEGALSVGNGSASRQITGVAAGSEDTDAVNLAQLKNAMTHYYSVKTTETTDKAGNNNYLNDGATGNNALAAGVSAVAKGNNATAVGTQTYASGENASAYGYRSVASGPNSLAIGSGTSAQQEGSVAVGGHAQGYYAVQVGTGSTAQGSYSASVGGHAIGNYSIAIGSSKDNWGYINAASAAGDNSIAIGGHTNSANNIAIGSGSATSGQYAITVGGHATSNQAVSIGGVATNSQAIAVGYGSSSTGSQSTAVGGHAGGTNSTAVGQGANANYAYATAVGNSSVASGDHSTALGYGTSVQGSSSTAIGGASAKGSNVTAIGKNSTVGGDWSGSISDSTVIGGAHISASDAAAIGSNATVNGQYGVALGYNSNVSYASTGVGSGTKASNTGTAVGYGAQSSGYQSAAVGAGSNATGQNAVALGGGGAWGNYSIALGSGAGTTAHGIAIGQNSGAWGESAIAIGEGSNAWRANSIVLGKNSKSGADKNIEGYDPHTGVASVDDTSTWQSTDEAVSIGRAEERDGDGKITATAITRQLNNLAAGTLDTDAVNVAQLKAATQKVNVHDYSVWSPDTETDTNYTNAGAVAKNSMAAGVSASTTEEAENAVAIGYKAKAEGVGATVIGQYGTATGQYATAFGGINTDSTGTPVNNTASGANSLAFGERTAASGNNSTAFGWQTTATQKRATAFGERTTASGANSTAFGQLAVASGQNSTAFGNEAVANNYGTTAFGNRTEALGEYSTAFGNSTVAAGMNTVAFGTDNVAGAVLDGNGAYTNIVYQTNPKNGRVIKDTNGNPIELSREKMDARGNLAYTDDNGNTKSVTYTVSGGETHSYVLLQGEDGNTYIRDYRGNIRSAAIGDDGKVTVGDTALTNVTLKKATSGANGYHILSNANATVWGESSNASGEASTAFGVNSTASAKNSLAALGGTVDEKATNAAAIGNGAQARLADSIALGSGALANRSNGSIGYDVLTGKPSSNTSAAWVSNANAIAIGNDTEESLLTRQITGVAAGSLDTDAVNVAQLKAAGLSFTTNTKDASNTTDNYKDYKVVSRRLGDTIAIKASDEAANHSYSTSNLTTRIAENGDISILMDENPTFTSVTTGDVIFAGNPDLTDKDGKAAKADTNAAYGTKTLTNSQNITSAGNDTQATRLHYKDDQGHTYEVATMDDGQIYAGDIKTDGTPDSTGFARTMNQKTTINGGVTEKVKLTDGNIGVVSNGTDTLTVKLAKDLKDLNSVTTGKTVQNDSGIKITNDPTDDSKNVVINGDQISFGGNQVKNMGSGSDGTADGKPTYKTDTNGANIGDVKNIANSTVQPVINTVNKGWELDVNGTKQKAVTPTSPKVNLIQGQNITITGDKTNTENVTIATADDVRFNTVRVGGVKSGDTYSGGIVIGVQSGKNADGTESANSSDGNYIIGLDNRSWDSTKIQHGRAATEDQLLDVATKIQQGSVAGDIYVTGGSVTYNGEGSDTNPKDGKGSIKLTRQNGTDVPITGLHDYYITDGTVTNDGKTLELTRNDVDGDGNHQKITVDLGNVLKNDQHLVTNPDAADGKYTVNTTNGTVTLKVKNGDTYDDITIGGFEGLGRGLKFGANQKVAENGSNPVTNQLGSTINITGAGAKALTQYSGKNLVTSVEQDAAGNTTIHVLMDKNISADGVTVGQAGKDGVAGADGEIGQAGTIGINGKNGVKGEDGKEGITTTIIRTEKGQPGADGKNGKPGVDGTDITRIVYQNGQDGTDGKDTHTVATLDDGLKFAGDDGQNDDTKVITKKLNERLDIVGKAQGELTDANIGVTKYDNGKLYIRLAKHVNLDGDGTLQAGDAKIGHFTNTELTTNKNNHPSAGSYTIGLGNKDWNVDSPDYVSGRAATEDQLATVSAAINNATTAAGKRTVVTVNDKAKPTTANPGTNAYGEYDSDNGNLMIAAERDTDGLMTYNIKMNDKLTLGKDGKDGKDGTDGQEGTIGLTGKDGLPGADGKQGYSTTIIKTEKGQPGADGKNGKPGVDGTDITRIVYTDKDGSNPQTVATMDDGLKFVGNDGQKVTRKLNETLSIKGGLSNTDVANASAKNLGVRKSGDGLEIVMTDTPDFTKVTVGGDKKITIGEQTVTGKKSDGTDGTAETGNYITGLDNTKWNKDNVVANRAATEGQLSQAINDIKGSTNGGFGLADEKGGTVKKDLGDIITVKGDGKNIETKVDGGALEVSLKKDVDLGNNGSIKAGNITINSDGVDTNKVKVGDITITKDDGINGGGKQITNIASGIDGKQYKDAGDNNGASIGDVKQLAKNEAKASEAKSGKNITVKDDHTVNLNDDITLGNDSNKQVAINGSNGQVTIGSGDKAMTLGKQANTAGDSNPKEGNFLNGLDNRKWDGEYIQNGRAATEDQLKTVSDKVNSGRKFQGDDGKDVTVDLGKPLNIKGGATEVSEANNIGIVKGDDNTLNVRLAKDLTGLSSVTTGNTTINNSGLTVKTGDANRTITVQDGNVNMGGNKIEGVAPGKIAPDSTDAVNGSQLYATNQNISNLGGEVNRLGTRVNRVGANAAALAALHPLDFDPDDKWDFAAGYGNYKNANAAAIGAYYRPNEDTMFSVGGSFGGGENMVNAGISVKLGQGNHVSTSRVAMAKEIKDLRKDVADLKAVVNQQSALIDKLTGVNAGQLSGSDELFPDVPSNHWAYEYVTKLRQAGILTGYPDGNFAGDRMMTRYEFAAIVYRAIMAGAAANPNLNRDGTLDRLAKEFSGEMKYIRIDTIRKDRNGKPTIQRVRVIKEEEK